MERTIEHEEVEGYAFTIIPIIPFEEWVQAKYRNINKFFELARKDKEKIFLRWKWGFSEDVINESLEISEKQTLRLFRGTDLNKLSAAVKYYIEEKFNFERICNETKLRIGLGSEKANPEVKKIIDAFDGREVD